MNIAQHLLIPLFVFAGIYFQAQAQTSKNPENGTEVATEEKSLWKTAANNEFSKSLYFDQIDNGVVLPPLELEYDLKTSEGKSLTLGSVVLNEETFNFSLLSLGGISAVSSDVKKDYALLMRWPEEFLTAGNIEMISRTGSVLWKYSFTQEDREKWRKKLNDLKNDGLSEKSPLFAASFVVMGLEKLAPGFFTKNESFRFCLSQNENRAQTKICSRRYGLQNDGKKISMGKIRSDAIAPRVLVQSEDAPLKNSLVVAKDMPTSFYSELATGESYEFVAIPNSLFLMDISDTAQPRILRIIAHETRPVGPSTILNPDQYTWLTRVFGFEPTMGDSRKFWSALVREDDAKIYLPGKGGGIFKQRFEVSEIPRRKSRVFLHERTPTGTYIDGIVLKGRKPEQATVVSSQNSVQPNEKDSNEFFWNFKATERGQLNKSYLNVSMDGKTYRSYYEIYKGYPRELSGRFSGVSTTDSMVFLGEVAYNQWFEDLFGWTNYYFSRQRWGISAKYFQSANKLKVDAAGRTESLNAMQFDVRYRFTPGLWGRDETLGALASYQNVTFGELKSPMIGGGVFWARSMPKVVDDLFNKVSFMRYPKWVDVEFIYYTTSMDSQITLNSSMSLNFHGKILWTKYLYGEAGFGIKRYGFSNSSINLKAELNSFYGTAGLGVNF